MASAIQPTGSPSTTIETTRARVTPPSGGTRFREALENGASAIVQGVESAAPLLPGGPAVSAAVRGTQAASTSSWRGSLGGRTGGGTAERPGAAPGTAGGTGAMLDSGTSNAMEMLALQQRISEEQRQYSTLSNVMKARHDSAKQIIDNVR